jgi:hypothetical protein
MSPTGSDANTGLSTATAWASPNHSVQCGDVIIAAPGAYNSANLGTGRNFGTVTACPSTAGGIDGTGGIYVANVVCATAFGCNVNANTNTGNAAINIEKSNWAVTGWVLSQTGSGSQPCFNTQGSSGSPIAYVAIINSIVTNCVASGEAVGWLDEFASVGVIAYNASYGTGECWSGLANNTPENVNSLSGTHVFYAGNFSYRNINGFCGNHSNGSGSYTTASASSGVGANSITVAATSNWVVGMPIGDLGTSATATSNGAIPAGTYITSIAGKAIGLSKAIVSPGVSISDRIAAMTTTDGEGLILDTWGTGNGGFAYTGQTVVEQNVIWGNGGSGFEMFCNGTCQSGLSVHVFNNTIYGNVQDPKHQASGEDLFINTALNAALYVQNNLIQSDVTMPAGSVYNSSAQTGYPVVAAAFGSSGYAISGNYFKSASGASCPQWATCDSGKNLAGYNGNLYSSGNTLSSPGFSNPGVLPTAAPNCAGFATTAACMSAAGVVADLTPSGGAVGKGYAAPGACAADAYYPAWLKGVVYLTVNGSALTESTGLLNKPCNM